MSTLKRPLHGDVVYSLKISTTTGKRELAKRRYAMEFDLSEIVQSTIYTDSEGIFVIDLFEAQGHTTSRPTTLESAIQRNSNSQRFLVTGVARNLMVATSRIGYPEAGAYDVVSSSYLEGYDFDMFDVSEKLDDGRMLNTHTARVIEKGGDVNTIAEFDVEDLFRRIALFSPERH